MKGILFNTDMVRAILEGRKTVTRRVVKPQPASETHPNLFAEPPYHLGDTLYVRETWSEYNGVYIYKTHCRNKKILEEVGNVKIPWRPSIHMPKEAARLFLRVTDVRIERLQDITEEQAQAEGIFLDSPDFIPTYHYSKSKCNIPGQGWSTARECFCWGLWDSTIKKADLPRYGWAANPWVWVIEFEKIAKDEAQKGSERNG